MKLLKKHLDEVAAIQCPKHTKKRLMDAAISCVKQWGIDKTSLNDIAAEAGCTRQTVYNYYKNKDDVIFVALIESAEVFSENLMAHVKTFDTPEEKILEGIMYCLTQLPDEPYLQLITDKQLSPLLNPDVFNSDMCIGLINDIARFCVEGDPDLEKYAEEIGESMTRIVLSLLSIEGPYERTNEELRAYITRRFLPVLVSRC